ncbi:MAG: leucine-rich repeat domain-containing protein, partial [Oscillospiraceae bacterium]|nr:leucine-rich repeat domain-containing protein [Oscillospiraceae bacterium]
MGFRIEDGVLKNYTSDRENSKKLADRREHLQIPENVQRIGSFAFSNRSGIARISISKNVREISYHAFYPCPDLEEIHVDPRNRWLSSIDGCLYDKSGKTLVCCPAKKAVIRLSWKVCKVDSDAFAGCHALQFIEVAKLNLHFAVVNHCLYTCCVTQLQELVRCPVDLEELHIPLSVSKIREHAFESCTKLREIRISEKIREIPNYTFRDCTSLESVKLPKNLQRIGDHGFYNCQSLRDVEIPPGTKTLIANAFGICKNLERLVIPCSVTHVGYIAMGCNNLQFVSCHGIELRRESYSSEEWDQICSRMSGILWLIVQRDFKEKLFEPFRTILIFRMAVRKREDQRTGDYLKENFITLFENLITENQLAFFREHQDFFKIY